MYFSCMDVFSFLCLGDVWHVIEGWWREYVLRAGSYVKEGVIYWAIIGVKRSSIDYPAQGNPCNTYLQNNVVLLVVGENDETRIYTRSKSRASITTIKSFVLSYERDTKTKKKLA